MESDYNNIITLKPVEEKIPAIWSFASGKGGVGKTLISTGFALTLAKKGYSVLAIDMDLTGANMHTAFGCSPQNISLRHFFEGSMSLSSTLQKTKYPRLNFVQGFWDSWSPTELTQDQILHFFSELKKLSFDFVIIDLGPGGTKDYLQIFHKSDEKFLITTPDPSSIEKTYRFLESFICSNLKTELNTDGYNSLLKSLRDSKFKSHEEGFFSFRNYLKQASESFDFKYFDKLSEKPIRLILNNSRSQTQMQLGYSIKSVVKKYFDLRLEYTGCFPHDSALLQSKKNNDHTLDLHPFSPLVGEFLTISKQLIDLEPVRAVS